MQGQVQKTCARAGVVLFFAALAAVSMAAFGLGPSEYMPLAEVRPGMQGLGKTVVRGDTIETFHVQVIDVIDNPGPHDYILVRVSGGAIASSGGVASGMSGSPVYIDGKLIGALRASALWQTSTDPLAWLTPIESMLGLVDMLSAGGKGEQTVGEDKVQTESSIQGSSGPVPVTAASGRIRELRFVTVRPSEADLRANPHVAYVVDLCPGLLIGGLSGQSLSWLREGLADDLEQVDRALLLPDVGPKLALDAFLAAVARGLPDGIEGAPVSSPGGGISQRKPSEFVPGAPLGILLMSGDIYYGWVGTVTFVQEVVINGVKRTVAVGLGHPVLGAGDVHYLLSPVAILDTVQTLLRSFKLAVPIGIPGAPVVSGSVTHDRDQGVAAIVGEKPRTIRLTMRVEDSDRRPGKYDTYSVDVTPMPQYFPVLTLIAGYQAVYSTLNRVGPGTMSIRYTIRGDGLPRDIVREDVFVANDNIGLLGPLQVARVAYLLAWNEFADVALREIEVEMRITSRINAVVIQGVETEWAIYQPGDEVRYVVALRTYRGETKLIRGTLTLPTSFAGGEVRVWAIPEPYAQLLIAYARHGWTRPMSPVYELGQLLEQVEKSSKGDTFWVVLERLGYPYVEDRAERPAEAADRVRDIYVLGKIGLDGAVTGWATWTILVQEVTGQAVTQER